METHQEWIEAGALVGRQQAFALIGAKCSAAQALSLKQLKESQLFEKLGVNWEEYCPRFAGISRVHADSIIRQFDEFGEAYFRLSELVRISPETYRRIAPQIDSDGIEIDGEKLALTPENVPRIRAAIQALRAQLRQAQSTTKVAGPSLKIRMDTLLDDVQRITNTQLSEKQLSEFAGFTSYAARKWDYLAETLQQRLNSLSQ